MSVLKVNQIQTANGVIMANLNSSGANIGFQLASSLAPAFSAYQSSGQSVATGTNTKVSFQTEEYDTNGNFDSTTNYRFTPTVAGYYQVNARVDWSFTTGVDVTGLYKNGSNIKYGALAQATNSGCASTLSALVYMNGTSDYLELYTYQNNGTNTITAAANATYFQAYLARSA